jgi:hypothetical protein
MSARGRRSQWQRLNREVERTLVRAQEGGFFDEVEREHAGVWGADPKREAALLARALELFAPHEHERAGRVVRRVLRRFGSVAALRRLGSPGLGLS